MSERIRIEYEGEAGGMRRAVSNALRLAERDVPGPEPIDQRVTITITDQPAPARSVPMGTTAIRSDQQAVLDPDWVGRISGDPKDIAIGWELEDPDNIGRIEDASEAGDSSRVRFIPTPGNGGIATVIGRGILNDQEVFVTETFEVGAEGVVFAGTSVTVEDQPAPETPDA
jgi:hypothetical protein